MTLESGHRGRHCWIRKGSSSLLSGMKLAQGFSAAGEGLSLGCSWAQRPRSFWFSLKFSGCLSGLLRSLWLCPRAGCAVLSATHPSDLGSPRMRENCRWGIGWLRESCSAVFVIRDPHLQWQNLTSAKSSSTDGEVDKGKLGASGPEENPLGAYSWRQTCPWADKCFLVAVQRIPKCLMNEISLNSKSFSRRCWYPHMPQDWGWMALLRVRDGVRVKKILVLNVNFWQLKKSYLRLKLKSENLGSA